MKQSSRIAFLVCRGLALTARAQDARFFRIAGPEAVAIANTAGYFAPNGHGLCDVAGNVWERCWDRYGNYASAPQTDPHGLSIGACSWTVMAWADHQPAAVPAFTNPV
jgi:hypothetical protein